jgi:hypothetical protein
LRPKCGDSDAITWFIAMLLLVRQWGPSKALETVLFFVVADSLLMGGTSYYL